MINFSVMRKVKNMSVEAVSKRLKILSKIDAPSPGFKKVIT